MSSAKRKVIAYSGRGLPPPCFAIVFYLEEDSVCALFPSGDTVRITSGVEKNSITQEEFFARAHNIWPPVCSDDSIDPTAGHRVFAFSPREIFVGSKEDLCTRIGEYMQRDDVPSEEKKILRRALASL